MEKLHDGVPAFQIPIANFIYVFLVYKYLLTLLQQYAKSATNL